MPHETDASIGTLLRGAVDDVRDVFREEVALARAELRQELSKARSVAVSFAAANGAHHDRATVAARDTRNYRGRLRPSRRRSNDH